MRTFAHRDTWVVTLTTGDNVTTTSEHPFWADGQGWTAASELRPGDRLRQPDSTTITVEEVFPTGSTATVYNFEVKDNHNYYVQIGSHWGLVHNQCVTSVINRDPFLVRAAQEDGKNQGVQKDLDGMVRKLAAGNMNLGTGTKPLTGTGLSYARTDSGARLFFRNTKDGVQIVAKADKGNEDKAIARLRVLYGR